MPVCHFESCLLLVFSSKSRADSLSFLKSATHKRCFQTKIASADNIGHADIQSILDGINRGEIYRYIPQPWNDSDITLVVRHALERKALEQEKKRLEALTRHQNEALRTLNAQLEAKVEERAAAIKIANQTLQTVTISSRSVFLRRSRCFPI